MGAALLLMPPLPCAAAPPLGRPQRLRQPKWRQRRPLREASVRSRAACHALGRRARRQDNCTDLEQPCLRDGDCRAEPPLAYGLCEHGHCVRLGWCPHEDKANGAVTELTVLQEPRAQLEQLEHLEIDISADISFPRLGETPLSTDDGRRARTRWSVAEVLRRSGANVSHALEYGAVLSVELTWHCDLNPGAKECIPALRVHRLVNRAGFSKRWGDYYQEHEGMRRRLRRDEHSAAGLRMAFSSRGSAERLMPYEIVIEIFIALALLPLSKAVVDAIMQNFSAERRHYREYKAEETPDFSDVRALVDKLEDRDKMRAEQEGHLNTD